MSYSRRFRAEVSNGIGFFSNCIEILTKLSVMTNVLIIFFTSDTFKMMFSDFGPKPYFNWSLYDFLKVVVIVEHSLMIL